MARLSIMPFYDTVNRVYVLNWYSLWHPPGISIIDFYFFMIIIGIFVFVVKFRFLITFFIRDEKVCSAVTAMDFLQ